MKNLWFTTARKMCSKWTPWQRLVFRHIFCYRVIWTSKTTFSREAHPLSIVCTLLHSLKCTDWVAIFKHDIIGLLGFEDNNEYYVTINTDRYVQVIRKFWTTLGQQKVVVRATGSSMTMPPHTPQKNHWDG